MCIRDRANAAWVPPFGSGATLYVRPYMFGSNPVIGVKPADEYLPAWEKFITNQAPVSYTHLDVYKRQY